MKEGCLAHLGLDVGLPVGAAMTKGTLGRAVVRLIDEADKASHTARAASEWQLFAGPREQLRKPLPAKSAKRTRRR